MSHPSIHTGSSSRPRPSSPSNDPNAPGSDNTEDQDDPAFWKRRYFVLRETVDVQTPSKRKSGNTTSTSLLGRGIRKVIFICGDINNLVSDSDKHSAYLDNPDDIDLNNEFEGQDEDEVEELKRNWERSHTAVQELNHLIPNFQKTIDEGTPEELKTFYAELQCGADSARSDDLNRIRSSIADWLNATERPAVLLNPNCHMNRGIAHDVTGRLLCPAEFDWDDLVVRAKLRASDEEFDWLSSYQSTCFYAKFKPDAKQLETGYLRSSLLIQVYKAIFTSPSSANDISEEEDNAKNIPPAKSQRTSTGNKSVCRNVVSKVHLNDKVTPRLIAYAAVQLHFNLQAASSWAQCYGGFDYRGLHNFIVDFFEDMPRPAAKQRAKELLAWWSRQVFSHLMKTIQLNSDNNRKIFPSAAAHRQSNTSASRKAFKQQRAAREREAAT